MTDRLVRDLVFEVPVLRRGDTVATAVKQLIDSGLPGLPVVDEQGGLAGIFGEREFLRALFPGYLGQLTYAGFVRSTLDEAIEKRAACASEHVGEHINREHVAVDRDFSDVQVAETFLHHDVLVIPVVDSGKVVGVITRASFFRRLASHFQGSI